MKNSSLFRVWWISRAALVAGLVGCGEDAPVSPQASEDFAAATSALTPVGWTKLANYPGGVGPQVLQLLTDGSVLAADRGSSATWRRFSPSATQGYAGGSWATTGSSRYGREAFPVGMLRDGRVFVGGGEYVFVNGQPVDPCYPDGSINYPPSQPCGPSPPPFTQHIKCEIYNPSANNGLGAWTDLPDFQTSSRPYLADGLTAPLPDGTLLVAGPDGDTWVFNPTYCPMDGGPCGAGAWNSRDRLPGAAGGSSPPGTLPFPSEGSMTMLQNGNIFLTQQYHNSDTGALTSGAAIYTWNAPAPRWSLIPHGMGQGPVNDPFNTAIAAGEGGSALTLYDGRVLITGGSSFNAIYDPTLLDPINNIDTTPFGQSLSESTQLVMPTGHALLVADTLRATSLYRFYDYTPPAANQTTGSLVGLPAGGPSFTSGDGNVSQTNLPDGSVMIVARDSGEIFLYRPTGPLAPGRPSIGSVAGFVNGVYTLKGTNLNGLTNGSNRDDEGHNYTAFPIVAVTFGTQTRYCPVTQLFAMAIAPNIQTTVEFKIPADVPRGSLSLSVSASGLPGTSTTTINNTLVLPLPSAVLM